MENKFSKEELHEIYEIISRPFLDDIMNNIHNNKKKVKKTKSKSRKHRKTFRKHIKQSGIIIQDVVNSEIREIFRK
jgi:DNA-binding protein Fis